MLRDRSGQSLVEILIGIVVGVLLVLAATSLITPALRAGLNVSQIQASTALGKELLDNVRTFAEGDWHNISALATSSANPYYILAAQSPFTAVSGRESAVTEVPSGLIGYWKLDEATGTVAHDFSGSGLNGALSGVTLGQTGRVYNAMLFNGTNSYAAASSTGAAVFSVSAWVKPNGTQTDGAGILSDSGGSDTNYRLVFNGGTTTLFGGIYSGAAWHNTPNSPALSTSSWSHVVFAFDGSSLTLFVDATRIGSTTWSGTPGHGDALYLGRYSTIYYNGYVDDVRIYNRALSATEVAQLYKATAYDRYFYLDDVYRDTATGNVTSTGGSYDPSTKKMTVVFGWNGGATSSLTSYITRAMDQVVRQTDWAGGPNQDGPVTSANSRFATSSALNYSSTAGAVNISGL